MILIATQCFPPRCGGMENLMGGLAMALADRGRRLLVYADGHGEQAELERDRTLPYPIERNRGFKPLRRLHKALRIRRRLAAGDIAGLFTDSWKSAEWIADAALTRQVPLVCLAHGNELLDGGSARRRLRILKTLSRTHRVAANSEDTAARVRALGVEAHHVKVVHPGISPLATVSGDELNDLALGSPVLLTLARLEPRKGQDRVIAAAAKLVREFPSLSYVIAGDGPDRVRLQTLCHDAGLTERVTFTGRVSETRKAALLARADLFIMPNRFEASTRSVEGFGIVYIEAALAGVPSIAGRSGGAQDAVLDGVTGLLCDGDDPNSIADTLRRCLRDRDLLISLGRAAQRRARANFLWPSALDAYLDCLE